MSYSCEIDDPPSVLSEWARTARTSHRCTECRGRIEPGERYVRTFGVWGGEADTFRTCQDCTALLEWTRAHIPCFCWSYSEMRSDAHEAVVAVLEDEPVPGMFMEFGRLWVACKRRGARGRAQLKGAQ